MRIETHSFNVELAEKYSMKKAVLLQYIAHWVLRNSAEGKNFKNGRHWTYNSGKGFERIFSYIPSKSIIRILKEMEEKDGLVISGNFNKHKNDRTKWYTLSDEIGSLYGISITQNEKCISQNEPTISQNEPPIPIINLLSNTSNEVQKNNTSANEKSRLISHYNEIICLPNFMSGREVQFVESYVDELIEKQMEINLFDYSIQLAIENNKRSMNYVRTILDNWIDSKIMTVVQAKEASRKFKKKKTYNSKDVVSSSTPDANKTMKILEKMDYE